MQTGIKKVDSCEQIHKDLCYSHAKSKPSLANPRMWPQIVDEYVDGNAV